MLFLRVLSLLCLFAANIRASSHWIVTETGLIQSKDESPFLMSRPFDLVSFLNQEIRWQNIFNSYDSLLLGQKIINGYWTELEEQSDITSHISENEHCKAIGDLGSIDWYMAVVEDGKGVGIYEREFLLYAIEEFGETEVPDCKKISSLTFSMSTFEHLEGMVNRGRLNATAESRMPQIFSSVRTLDQYGHWLAEVLRRNTTSWLHYNLAAIFWRLKGNVPKALECSRRAVHYAPRRYKAVPLLCMGSILHRSRKTEDAIIVLGASVDHAPTFSLGHLALGEAYAVAGDFNSSIKHFNASMKLRKGFSQAMKYQKAAMCHIDLLTKMQYTQRTINKLNKEMREFAEIETEWFKTHSAFLRTVKHDTEYNDNSVERNCHKMEEITNLKIRDLHRDRERNTLIQYLVRNPVYTDDWVKEKGVNALSIAYDLEKAVKRLVKQSGPVHLAGHTTPVDRKKVELLKEMGPVPTFPEAFPDVVKLKDESVAENDQEIVVSFHVPLSKMSMLEEDDEKVIYPATMRVSRNHWDFDIDPEWPSNEFCQKAKSDFPDSIETVYPVILPFEHKGMSVQSILSDKIGVPPLQEHELPWHPPLCPADRDLHLYTGKKGAKVLLPSRVVTTEYFRLHLIKYVSLVHFDAINNKQNEEIGQRIHTAMHKNVGPRWVVYSLAGLYWRVRGNSANAINCLLRSYHAPDVKHPDVPLVALASLLLDLGLVDDALARAEDAHRLNQYEPSTNFLLSIVHMVKKQQLAQFAHLKQVLRVDPSFMNGKARSLLNCWACIAKQINTLRELGVVSTDIDDGDTFCAETESGASMLCGRDGSDCHITNRKCTDRENAANSALVSLLEMRDEGQPPMFIHKHLADRFRRVLQARPLDRRDAAAHLQGYELMRATMAEQMALCKMHDCGISYEGLDLTQDECMTKIVNANYWLLYVSFQQELSDDEQQILAEIASMRPSHKKTPECVVPAAPDEDFFLSRMLAVDAAGWSAMLVVLQHFTALVQQDYRSFGAKIARYVETKSSCWWGALVAGWWCGASGRSACAVRCFGAAHALAPAHAANRALRPLVAFLLLHRKDKEAMSLAYLSFYASPHSKEDAFLVGLAHFYHEEIDEAIWMYRYALAFDHAYVPATVCIHTALCHLTFDKDGNKKHQTPT